MVRRGAKKRERRASLSNRRKACWGRRGKETESGMKWKEKKSTNFSGIPGKMYLRLRCNRGALARGAARLAGQHRAAFCPLFNGEASTQKPFRCGHMKPLLSALSRRLRRRFHGRNRRPWSSWRELDDGALESEEFGPSGVLNEALRAALWVGWRARLGGGWEREVGWWCCMAEHGGSAKVTRKTLSFPLRIKLFALKGDTCVRVCGALVIVEPGPVATVFIKRLQFDGKVRDSGKDV